MGDKWLYNQVDEMMQRRDDERAPGDLRAIEHDIAISVERLIGQLNEMDTWVEMARLLKKHFGLYQGE